MNTEKTPVARFRLGRIVATPGALARLTQDEILAAIKRHQAGDWGEVDEHDRQENEHSLKAGRRLWSIYRANDGTRFYLITEADRSATTILLSGEY